jgi:hypothetical protein
MATCRECACYEEIDENTGKCKKHRADRCPGKANGWPIVIGDEKACIDDFE